MDSVAITIDLSKNTGTIHYTSCGYFTGYHTNRNRRFPESVKLKPCKLCRPRIDEIVAIAQEIEWEHKTADAMSRCGLYAFDDKAECERGRLFLRGTS